MNLKEALKALNEGKKIRRMFYKKPSYQFKDGVLLTDGKPSSCFCLNVFDLNADDWEVVKEFYITKDEKEYLENLLRLYRDDYDFTFEKVMSNEHLYLKIAFFPYNEDNYPVENMFLPLFGINKPMFEGLEINHLYNFVDLNLFHE